ncbi:hypothetical protein GUJ93_ZPchr0010g9442 [Zizania palustris]|uniref:Uncharacterized protein n=1 Tax=Zizania palustris TaxID=103762 RepID=A0A8J5WCS9_ZIZPA|nr:hypothetical protein GUJ93_ZPchr0010g9442 [Zizania palustris]
MTPNESGTSSGNKPSKRAKKDDSVVDGLVGTIDRGTETLASLAEVIKEVAAAKTTPEGLFEEVDNLPVLSLHRTVEAASSSSTTEADEMHSLCPLWNLLAVLRGVPVAAVLVPEGPPSEDSTVEMVLHEGLADVATVLILWSLTSQDINTSVTVQASHWEKAEKRKEHYYLALDYMPKLQIFKFGIVIWKLQVSLVLLMLSADTQH